MPHQERVIIGVDPHKLSATIEVVDDREHLLGSRTVRHRPGAATPRCVKYVRGAGRGGPGRSRVPTVPAVRWRSGCWPTGEQVVDVPAKLAARVRLFDTGHNRKTDAHDAHSIAVVAVRTKGLRVLAGRP